MHSEYNWQLIFASWRIWMDSKIQTVCCSSHVNLWSVICRIQTGDFWCKLLKMVVKFGCNKNCYPCFRGWISYYNKMISIESSAWPTLYSCIFLWHFWDNYGNSSKRIDQPSGRCWYIAGQIWLQEIIIALENKVIKNAFLISYA